MTYGVGTENQNLRGFIVLCPGMPTELGVAMWTSAFLPGVYQGTHIRNCFRKISTHQRQLPFELVTDNLRSDRTA